MISQTTIQNWGKDLSEAGEDITLNALVEMRKIVNRMVDDPDYDGRRRWEEFTEKNSQKWENESIEIITGIVASGYWTGITLTDRELSATVQTPNAPMDGVPFDAEMAHRENMRLRQISGRGQKLSKRFPRHTKAYQVLESSYAGYVHKTFQPVIRSHRDVYRQVETRVLIREFREGGRKARHEIAQRAMSEFARRGISAITYADGRQVPIDVYSNMVARTAGQKSAMQASVNRLKERGYKFVRVNQYAGASDLCEPWQGGVYTIDGTSEKYKTLDEATFDGKTGLFHPNCGHSISAFIPGSSERKGPLTDDPDERRLLMRLGEADGNAYIYEQRQVQRMIENEIRKNKRILESAIDPDKRKQARKRLKNWNNRLTEHLQENKFLRRRRYATQI